MYVVHMTTDIPTAIARDLVRDQTVKLIPLGKKNRVTLLVDSIRTGLGANTMYVFGTKVNASYGQRNRVAVRVHETDEVEIV